MASTNPVVRQIEKAAATAYPKDMGKRFDERNRLRAEAGLPQERRERGGAAGLYDNNKNLVKPVLAIAASAFVPGVGVLANRLAPVTKFAASLPPTLTQLASSLVPTGLVPSGFAPTSLTPSPVLYGAGAPPPPPPAPPSMPGVGGSLGGAVATTILTGLVNRFLPPPPPSFGPQQGGAPRPKEGVIGRTISRLLPGGMTGREWTPVNDMTDRVGRPLAVYPAERTSVVGPAGYVMVTMNGERIAMLKTFATRAGLYKAPPKPPLSGYDMRAINRAASASKRVKKLAGKVGFRCEKKGTGRALARPFTKKR